jgi:hypothetical protein
MSYLGRIRPKYISLGVSNLSEESTYASIHQDWGIPPIQKLDDHVVCIERLEINLNGIPFYHSNPNNTGNEVIEIVRKTNLNTDVDKKAGTTAISISLSKNYYSLGELLDGLNLLFTAVPINLTAPTQSLKLIFGLTHSGKIKITNKSAAPIDTFTNFWVKFPKNFNLIMGFLEDDFLNGLLEIESTFPRIDCGDEFNHLLLVSTLPVISDSIDVVQSNCLTDISLVTGYSSSMIYKTGTASTSKELEGSGWSLDTRQKLVYVPNERRYLDLIAPFALRYITIDAFYQNNEGLTEKVILPLGATFQIKLGFYMK